MEIKYGKQITADELVDKNISLFLFAGNHEKRVFNAYEKLNSQNQINKTLVLCYDDSFSSEGHGHIECQVIKFHQEISAILDSKLQDSQENDEITIVIDYSCMTKSWYYTIILYLKKKQLDFQKVTVYFVYTPSKYSDPLTPKPNTEIAPLPGKYVVPTDKPKALIVCLGYEQNKAEGIIEHLDPKECYLMYSKPALDADFVDKIESNNSEVLKNRPTITFPLDDLLTLERELTSLYYLLKDQYSVIIAPLGPKPFTFISMLMSIKYPDIDIWRVGSGSDINEYEREAISKDLFIISKVVFEKR